MRDITNTILSKLCNEKSILYNTALQAKTFALTLNTTLTVTTLAGNRAIFCVLHFAVRDVIRKKTGLCGKSSQAADPPHPPPPVWETPVIKKKKLGLFFILGPQEHFWSSPKNHHFG